MIHELYHYKYLTSLGFELRTMDTIHSLVHTYEYWRNKECVKVTHGSNADYFAYINPDGMNVHDYAYKLQEYVK